MMEFIFSYVEKGVMILMFNCLECLNSFNDEMYV